MAQQTETRSKQYGSRRRVTCFSLGLLLAGPLFFPCLTVRAQERADSSRMRQEVRALELGNPIERELKGGEVHSYQIKLTAGQYLHVIVDQRGTDVVVTLFGPDGKQLTEVDSPNGTQGPEPVSLVVENSGIYRLEVRSLEKDAAPGRYEVKVEELRGATVQDNTRIAAERAYAEATLLYAQGTAESRRRAIEKYEVALQLWRPLGDRIKEALILNQIAVIYERFGEIKKALEYHHQALPLRHAMGDRAGKAQTLNNMGVAYNLLGENQSALDSYGQAVPLWRALGDQAGEARTLHNIGSVYQDLGEPQKALDNYNQALPLRRAANDRAGEAYTLANIGTIYSGLGETQKALDCYNRALALTQAIVDRRGEAQTLHGLGLIYRELGEEQRALDFYNQALQLHRAMGNRIGEAVTLHNIGAIYNSSGDQQKALEYFQQALQRNQATNDRAGEAHTLTSIGSVYDELNDKQKALDYYNQALALRQAVGDRRGEAITLHNIGIIHSSLDDNEKALDYFKQALALHRDVKNLGEEATTLHGIARAERDRGNLIEARSRIEVALTIVDSLRAKVASPALRASYFARMQKHYEFYIDLLLRLHQLRPTEGHDAAALQASERARGRSLLEILNEARVNIRQGVDSMLVERERALQQQLNAKAERLTRLLSGKHTEEQGAATKKELDALLTEYQEVQAQIRATSPSYAALTQPQPLSVKEIQQQVLDDGTILLEYELGKERSFLWAVTPTTINSFELPKRTAIDSLARRVYDLLTARNQSLPDETKEQKQARCTQADRELSPAAATLSRWVLGPVAGLLGDKRLLIVGDDALQYIPFGALPVPKLSVVSKQSSVASAPRKLDTDHWSLNTDYRPLAIDHEIVSIPSASVLAVLRRELAARQPAGKTVAVMADPVFTNDDPRVKHGKNKVAQQAKADSTLLADVPALASPFLRSVREMGATNSNESLSRLFFSRREAEGILQLVPAGEGMKAVDFAANRATATSAELSRYRMVHFATHGLLNSTHPELSGIVLSLVDEQGKLQDGFLRLHEIYNLNLPADLVVLSACQTALGKEIRGEGLVGLTRGFMYAGAAGVAASLWKVDDRATAELMRRFYEGMLGEKQLRPAAALRAAQMSLWKERRWQSPYYWAAFVLQGEWR